MNHSTKLLQSTSVQSLIVNIREGSHFNVTARYFWQQMTQMKKHSKEPCSSNEKTTTPKIKDSVKRQTRTFITCHTSGNERKCNTVKYNQWQCH